ncbi:branched chain amino acid aminotransferase, partial [Pseudomonas aeruginosa]|nr:branched chain amino acid aminotransferase [Pseudomonas aeruginosa]
IYTPEVTACLNGITRNTILTLAAEHGFKLVEKRITRDEVYIADEAFFTGTAAEVTPIREVDGRKIGAGRRGPVTEKLQKAYFDLVSGKTEAHAEWRTLVK